MSRIKIVAISTAACVALIGAGRFIDQRAEARGYEEGRYAMRQHIDDVRWLKLFNEWADAYDLAAVADGKPKLDRKKTFGEIQKRVEEGGGSDPTEANWLKINGFSS